MQQTGNAKSYTVLVVLKNPNRFTLPFTFNKIFPYSFSGIREYTFGRGDAIVSIAQNCIKASKKASKTLFLSVFEA